MAFEKRKISPQEEKVAIPAEPSFIAKSWESLVGLFGVWRLILIFLLLVLSAGIAAATLVLDQSVGQIITPKFLSPLDQDRAGNTNIALLGVAGAVEEGGFLTDSIIVVSINDTIPSVSLVSIPRDTWVSSHIGNRKINRVYSDSRAAYDKDRALEIAKKTIADFTGVDIHYGVVVDFQLFEEVIDELGGIDIFVSETIDDPLYPAANYAYQRFYIRKGQQKIDGETALKYARSRQTSSDYARAERQQKLLIALKETAQEQNILTDVNKLTNLWELYQKRVQSDMSLTQMVRMAKIGKAITREEIVSTVLSDDPYAKGGMLTPGDKSAYGGQFVLLPTDKTEIRRLFSLVFNEPSILLEKATIEILNAGSIEGAARQASYRLQELGFEVVNVGNYKDGEETLSGNYIQQISNADSAETMEYLKDLYAAKELKKEVLTNETEEATVDIQIILGKQKSQEDAGLD